MFSSFSTSFICLQSNEFVHQKLCVQLLLCVFCQKSLKNVFLGRDRAQTLQAWLEVFLWVSRKSQTPGNSPNGVLYFQELQKMGDIFC